MPVPSSIADLSSTPSSNSPAGSETPSSTDDYLRTVFAFIKQTYDAAQSGSTTWCGNSGGTDNAITLTPSPAITAYAAGQVFKFKATSTNTGATTVAVSGLAAIAVQVNGAACIGGEIVSGQWYELLLSSSSIAQLRTSLAPNLTTAINAKRAAVAATATTTPLWIPSNGNIQDWTGTPTITDFPAAPQAGSQREVYPAAGTVITNAGNISVQGNANYTFAAGDSAVITAITTTTFYVVIRRKDGVALGAPSAAVVGLSRNARMSTVNGSATATFTADEVVVKTSLGGSQIVLSSISKSINLATTGAGGMDTGSALANGFVGIYLIYNPTTSTSNLLGVNAATVQPEIYGGANMPAGYTYSALVAVLPVHVSNNNQFQTTLTSGRRTGKSNTTISGTGTSYTALSPAGVPPNARVITGYTSFTSVSAAGCSLLFALDTNGTGETGTTIAGGTGYTGGSSFEVFTGGSSLYAKTVNASGSTIGFSGYEI